MLFLRLMLLSILFSLYAFPQTKKLEMNEMHVIGKGEYRADELIDRSRIDDNGKVCAAILIESDLDGFSFQANNGIVKINHLPGRDFIFVSPTERVIELYRLGYQPLKIILRDYGIHLESGQTWALKVTGDKIGLTKADVDLFDVIFTLNQDSVYSFYSNYFPTLSKTNVISYKLPVGNYTFTFQKQGFADIIKTISLSENYSESVRMISGKSELKKVQFPGIVQLSSDPQGAEIIMNGQKIGVTPYQGEATPGKYEVEFRKLLYHSDLSSFTVDESKTISIKRPLKPRFGFLSVKCATANAEIILDGKNLGASPITKKAIESSKHTVTINATLYRSFTKEFLLEDGKEESLEVVLTPAFGSLEITTVPEAGANVYIDDALAGVTPFKKENMASGKYHIRVTKNLFADAEEQIIIKDAEKCSRTLSLGKNFGEIEVKAAESEIFMNGKSVGKEKYFERLVPGRYKFSASRGAKYTDSEQEVLLSSGDKKSITLTPSARLGSVSVFVEPDDASDAQVYLNNEVKGTAPANFPILIGSYNITVKKFNYLDVTKTVEVFEGKSSKIDFAMLTYEGSRKQISDKWSSAKWIGAGASAFSAVVGGYLYLRSNSNTNKYNSTANAAESSSLRSTIQSQDKWKTTSFTAAGAFLGSALICWIIQEAI